MTLPFTRLSVARPSRTVALLALLPLIGLATACDNTEPAGKDDVVDNSGTTGTTEPEPEPEPEPAAIAITFDSYTGDVGDTFTATVVVTDADGNELDVDTDLIVDLEESTDILGNEVTVLAEGLYTVTATLGDGSMPTAADPIRIDDNGPLISIVAPEPGTWVTPGETIAIEGTVTDALAGVDALTLDGEPVIVEADGSFSASVTLDAGAHPMRLDAADIDGNTSDAYVGVLSGDAIDPAPAMDGMLVHIGEDGLAGIAAPLLSELDPAVVEAGLKATNPVDRGSYSCVSYTVDVHSIDYGTPALSITPANDAVGMTVTLADLELKADVDANLCGFTSVSERITVTDTLTTITADIEMEYLSSFGIVAVGIGDSNVSYADLDVDYGSLDSLLATAGVDPADLGIDVGAIIADAILEVVDDQVPPPISAALSALQISETLDVLTVPVTLDAAISDVVLSSDGVEVQLDTEVTGPAPDTSMPTLPGVFSLGGDAPAQDPTDPLALSLRLDELNRILHTAHASGAFVIELSDSDLGLDPALVDFVFPGASTLNLSFSPTLPPVLTPQEAGADLDLSMLGIGVVATGQVDGVETELANGAVHVLGTVVAGVDTDGNISLEVTEIVPVVDLIIPAPDAVTSTEGLEDTFATLAVDILGDLFPTITFAIPDLGDVTLTGTGAATVGPANSWLQVDANIE